MSEDTVKLALMSAYDQLTPMQIFEAERRLGVRDLLGNLARLVDTSRIDQLRNILKDLDPELYNQVFHSYSGNPSG